MELTKIVLIMFVWPVGAVDDTPLWTSEPFLTIAECESEALDMKPAIQDIHGPDARIEHYCFSIEDRLTK